MTLKAFVLAKCKMVKSIFDCATGDCFKCAKKKNNLIEKFSPFFTL